MSGWVTVRAPYDGAELGEFPQSNVEDVERAVSIAAQVFADRGRRLPPERRLEVLRKAAAQLESRGEELARAAAREGGKPLADSRVEVARAVDGLHVCVEALRTQGGAVIPMDLNAASRERLAFTTFEPCGPVLAISAFNHPLNNLVHQVGPALAAGCPVVLKPAPATPLIARRFVELLRDAGLPEEHCQLVLPVEDDALERLVSERRLGFLSFIGAAPVGWALRGKMAPGVRLSLELGGVAPVLVDEGADLDDLVPRIVKGGYYHAGQVCVSVQRVFAHRSLARSLAERLAQAVGAVRVGDPTHDSTEVGPLIRRTAVDRVLAWVDEACSGGAELLAGGRRLSETSYAPTLLWDPPAGAHVSREEIFGPVVSVYPCASLEEMVMRANEVEAPFQAAVFTPRLDAALFAYRRLHAAAVMVNDHTAFRVDWMPFGGVGTAGLGTGGIPYTLRQMQVEKLGVLRSPGLA